jgi:hypothetical protein
VEKYRKQTRAIVKRFLRRKCRFPRCIADLDAALLDLLLRLKPADLPALRIEILANNEMVMKEMERRGPPRKKRPKKARVKLFSVSNQDTTLVRRALTDQIPGGLWPALPQFLSRLHEFLNEAG